MVKIMENPIKMDDLGVQLFLETPIYIHRHPQPSTHKPASPGDLQWVSEKFPYHGQKVLKWVGEKLPKLPEV